MFPAYCAHFRTLTPTQLKVTSKTKAGTALRCQLKHKPKVQVLDIVSVWNAKDLLGLGLGLGLGLMAARGLLRGWRLGMGGSILCDWLMPGWSRRYGVGSAHIVRLNLCVRTCSCRCGSEVRRR
jgi:hypothetical protein